MTRAFLIAVTTLASILANWVMTASASETRESRSAALLHCLPIKETLFRLKISSSIQRSGKVQSVIITFWGPWFISVSLADCQHRSKGMWSRPTLFDEFFDAFRVQVAENMRKE